MQDVAVLVRQFNRAGCLERNSPKMSRYKSRKAPQFRENTKNQGKQKMVAGSEAKRRLLERVAEVYAWIDQQLCSHGDLTRRCDACGRCCDFEAFDHRLFVTGPELVYLAANLDVEKLRSMLASRCPYNIDGRCTVYEHRFAGCRIFGCKADADFQSSLTEEALEKLKAICLKYDIPYRYTDLATALNCPTMV